VRCVSWHNIRSIEKLIRDATTRWWKDCGARFR
jgi:hypothetical protein